MKVSHVIPKSIREKLYPYKEKIYKGIYLRKLKKIRRQNGAGELPITQLMRSFSEKYGTKYTQAMLEKGWQEPGKMFDELGEIFAFNRKLFILGNSEDVNRVRQQLEFTGAQIDSAAISGHRLLSDISEMEKISKKTRSEYTVIIAYEDQVLAWTVGDALASMGSHFLNVNTYVEPEFFWRYIPIYCLYACDILYFTSISFLCTTVCNLNCEKCLNFKPYSKSMRHRPLEELEADIDLFFSCVDYVKRFHVSGGEPFLYPHLAELLSYIRQNYGNKIGSFETVTNCTVIPEDKLCLALRKNNVCVECDDYTQLPASMRKTFFAVKEKLQAHGVMHRVLSHTSWIDLFPPKEPFHLLSKEQQACRFRGCDEPFMEFRNGRLYSCNYMGYAVTAGLIPDCTDDTYDLAHFICTEDSRKKLLEFRCRFTKKGYVEFCKFCNGFPAINPHTGAPAKQADGLLTWKRPIE